MQVETFVEHHKLKGFFIEDFNDEMLDFLTRYLTCNHYDTYKDYLEAEKDIDDYDITIEETSNGKCIYTDEHYGIFVGDFVELKSNGDIEIIDREYFLENYTNIDDLEKNPEEDEALLKNCNYLK